MISKNLIWLVITVLLTTAFSAQAQQPKLPRIGFLSNNSLVAVSSWNEAFRQGLRELGYVEGKNLVIEWRFGEGKVGRLAEMAAHLRAAAASPWLVGARIEPHGELCCASAHAPGCPHGWSASTTGARQGAAYATCCQWGSTRPAPLARRKARAGGAVGAAG